MTGIALHPFFSVMSFFFFFFVFSDRNVLLEKKLIFVRKYISLIIFEKLPRKREPVNRLINTLGKRGKNRRRRAKIKTEAWLRNMPLNNS